MIHASTSVASHATVLPVGVSERGRGNCPSRTHLYKVVRDTAMRWRTSCRRSRRELEETVVVSIESRFMCARRLHFNNRCCSSTFNPTLTQNLDQRAVVQWLIY